MRNLISSAFVAAGALLLAYSAVQRLSATESTCAGGFFLEFIEADPDRQPGEETADWFMQCVGECISAPPGCHQSFTFANPPSNTIMDTWCGCSSTPGAPPPESPGGCSLTVHIVYDPVTNTSGYSALCHKTNCEGECSPAPGNTSHGWVAMCDCE